MREAVYVNRARAKLAIFAERAGCGTIAEIVIACWKTERGAVAGRGFACASGLPLLVAFLRRWSAS